MAETFKINNIDYSCEFKLKNSDGQEVNFTKSAIRGLQIVDNIFMPFSSGIISIANPYDFIEEKYSFRGDGRDELTISIYPVEKPNDKIEDTYILVDDSDNANPMTRAENIKTFALSDKRSLPFTDKVPYGSIFTGKVGAILKDIFKELLGDDSVDEENWEDGDFEIAYTPQIYMRYIDVIFYLLRHYYAKDGDIYVKGLLLYDSDQKKFQFKLISKIFEKNKDELLEAFILGDLTDKVNTSNPNNPPPEAEVGEYIGPLKNLSYSTPMYAWNNNYFMNFIIHGYDPILGIFKTKKITLDDIVDKWKKKFVEPFKSVGGMPKPFVVKNKTTSERFKHFKTAYSLEDSAKLVETEIHNILTFYNLQCNFVNIGATNRRTGKFIDIAKTNSNNIKSDEKVLGRWFITEIRHIFMGDTYTNEMLCCKTYIGPNSNISEDAE